MTCSGTLLSYSNTADIGELRSKAAILSQVWSFKCPNGRGAFPHSQLQDWLGVHGYLNVRDSTQHSRNSDAAKKPSLEYLTIETTPCNIIMKKLQENILVVLLGSNPPDKKVLFKLSAEFPEDPRYPSLLPTEEPVDLEDEDSADPTSKTPTWDSLSQYERDVRLGALHIQRKKLDIVADHLKSAFEKHKIVLPANGAIP